MNFFYHLFTNYFCPSLILNSIHEIDFEWLKKKNIKMIMFDLDDTLTKYNYPNPDLKTIDLFNKFSNANITTVIASNNMENRVKNFANQINSLNFFLSRCKKPNKKIISNFLKKQNIKTKNILFVGDRYLTDVFVAKKLKIMSCLIIGFHKNDNIYSNCEKYWLKKHTQK